MRLASFVMSFCLHAGFALLVVFWPAFSPHRPLPRPMTVSLVDGLPDGNKTPAPVLGPQSAPVQRQAPPVSAPHAEAPVPAAVPIPLPDAPAAKPEPPKPVPKPEPKQPDPPKPDVKKPEPPKPEPPKRNPAEEALAKLRAAASRPAAQPGVVAEALKHALKQSGGGGSTGSTGGSIEEVYGAQIVMAVQPNWSWPPLAQGNLSVTLYLKVDATGRVLDVRVEASSGNPSFDSSAVAAVRRTQTLPPPPTPAHNEIVLSFFPMR